MSSPSELELVLERRSESWVSSCLTSHSLSSDDDKVCEGDNTAPVSVNTLNPGVIEASGEPGVVRVIKVDATVGTSLVVGISSVVHKIVSSQSDEASCKVRPWVVVVRYCGVHRVVQGIDISDDVIVIISGEGAWGGQDTVVTGEDL